MNSPAAAAPPEASVRQSNAESRDLARWQRKLLPYMARFLVVLAFAFFGLSIYDMYEMRTFVKSETSERISSRVEELVRPTSSNQTAGNTSADIVQRSLLLLEADAMDKRYRQASALLMSRIWTRQLSFLTGMVLAFIGSIFILGKLSEAKTDISAGTDRWKGAISSTSPGLILASFGTVLIAISLIVQPKVEVQDRPIYFLTMGIVKNPDAPTTPNNPQIDKGPIDPGLLEPAKTK